MAGETTMRAVQYSHCGGGASALQVVETKTPSPEKNEVVVKVKAASLNPADWKIQKGMLRPFIPCKLPFTPGTDIAGEIVKVGSEVKKFKPGDRVVCLLNFTRGGGLAEYAVTSEDLPVIVPSDVSLVEAATVPMAALTAVKALMSAGTTKFDGSGVGKNILITAASGGVGTFAVQLAKMGNHHVTATCGARNLDLIRGLGADEVIDYKTTEGKSLTSPSGRKYDYIINCTDSLKWSTFKPALSDRGKVIDVAPNGGNMLASVTTMFARRKLELLVLTSGKKNLDIVLGLMNEGKLKTVIDSRHPLEAAAEAFAKCIDGHATGKIVVEM